MGVTAAIETAGFVSSHSNMLSAYLQKERKKRKRQRKQNLAEIGLNPTSIATRARHIKMNGMC